VFFPDCGDTETEEGRIVTFCGVLETKRLAAEAVGGVLDFGSVILDLKQQENCIGGDGAEAFWERIDLFGEDIETKR
jgi:hypothetical protein